MDIIFEIDDKEYRGFLKTMPLTEDIVSSLPAELIFEHGGDREYYAIMDINPDVCDSCRLNRIERNGLYWFPDWNAICIILNDTDISPYIVVHIGDMDDDIADRLLDERNRIKISVRA